MSDTTQQPGLISVDGPRRELDGKVYYHCDAPLHLLTGDQTLKLTDEMKQDLFAGGLDTTWGVLCMLLSNSMYGWFLPDDPVYPRAGRFDRYVRAVLRH